MDFTLLARPSSRAAVWVMRSIRVTLEAPHSAGAGETIPFVVVLANPSDAALDTHLQGREIIFDVTVSDKSGKPVWHRLANAVTQAILRLDTFAPGEARRLYCEWDQRTPEGGRVARGSYTVHASVPTESGSLESERQELKLT